MASNAAGPASFTLRGMEASQSVIRLVDSGADVFDKTNDGFKRKLPGNEKIALALNDHAAGQKRGFFYYLPAREVWKKVSSDARLQTAKRDPQPPGAAYPALLFMDFVWTETDRADFQADSHRARYLKCNAMINPPPSSTPLYAIQYVDSARAALYTTPGNRLTLIEAGGSYHVLTGEESMAIIGRWSSKNAPGDPDPQFRLATLPALWDSSKKDSGAAAQTKSCATRDVAGLYREIVSRCSSHGGEVGSSFDASQVAQIAPRPLLPQQGLALGRSADEVATVTEPAAEPPSRRQIKRKRTFQSKTDVED